MSKQLFIHFGKNLFDKFSFLKLSEESTPKESTPLFIFDSLVHNEQLLPVEEIHSCWSKIFFLCDGDLYHCGFKGSDVAKEPTSLYSSKASNSKGAVSEICAGWNHMLFTTEQKCCFHFPFENAEKASEVTDSRIQGETKHVSVTETQSCIITEGGTIYVMEKENGKFVLESLPPEPLPPCGFIVEVACGKEHTLFLSNDGHIFAFGLGSRGQLGIGEANSYHVFAWVEALGEIFIKSIAAGGWHSAAISDRGDLYTWGWNEGGQLGRKKRDEEVCCIPKLVEFQEDKTVKSVSLGSRHSAVLLDNNTVWTFGCNAYGQLGQNDECPCSDTPKPISLPSEFEVTKVHCSAWDTIITGVLKST